MSGLHIKKIDSLTKEPMEGVSFRVSEKDGRTIGEFKTDAQGSILIENLQPGWYTIRETDTLEGYILDETPRDVEFVWGQLITVEFTNDRKAELLVKKVDADTGEPLANAKFRRGQGQCAHPRGVPQQADARPAGGEGRQSDRSAGRRRQVQGGAGQW